ncbi:hypothetical protein ABZ793_23045 [Micromonospora sp. NPDC047465]|uniref:hypothetical protein n=1 Tax=Micromonospora sp. NPDC047465 TaxID=3154813 RepID=UPI0033F8C081
MASGARSAYDEAVLADAPVVYVGVDGVSGTDLAGRGHALRYASGAPPNGTVAACEYATVPARTEAADRTGDA